MDSSDLDVDEKLNLPPGELPPIGIPKLHLRRQKEDEYEKKPGSRSSSHGRARRRKRQNKDLEDRLGGPVSQSAIAPTRRSEPLLGQQESGSDTLFEKSGEPSPQSRQDRLVTESSSSSPEPEHVEVEHDAEADTRQSRQEPRSGGRHGDEEREPDVEIYEEGDDIIVEDAEGNVVETIDSSKMTEEETVRAVEKARSRLAKDKSGKFAKSKHEPHPKDEGEEIEENLGEAVSEAAPKSMRHRFDHWKGFGRRKDEELEAPGPSQNPERKRGPAHAYQFGNTVIVEDEDGEVIKTYTIPSDAGPGEKTKEQQLRDGIRRMSTWVGLGRHAGAGEPPSYAERMEKAEQKILQRDEEDGDKIEEDQEEEDKQQDKAQRKSSSARRVSDDADDGLRMTISRADQYGLTGLQKKTRDAPGTIALGSGRRLSTKDFIKQMQQLDPKSKIREVEESDANEDLKREIRKAAKMERDISWNEPSTPGNRPRQSRAETNTGISTANRPDAGRRTASEMMPQAEDYFGTHRRGRPDTTTTDDTRNQTLEEESEEEEAQIPTHNVRSSVARHGQGQTAADLRRRQLARIRSEEEEEDEEDAGDENETAAEKRRRLAALGIGNRDEDSSSESDEEEPRRPQAAVPEPSEAGPSSQPKARIQWGGEHGREKDPSDIYAGDPIVGAARKLRSMMKKKN